MQNSWWLISLFLFKAIYGPAVLLAHALPYYMSSVIELQTCLERNGLILWPVGLTLSCRLSCSSTELNRVKSSTAHSVVINIIPLSLKQDGCETWNKDAQRHVLFSVFKVHYVSEI